MSLSKVFGQKLALYNSKSWISISPAIQEVGNFIYTGSFRTSLITTKKYEQSQDGLSATEVWGLDDGADVVSIAVDSSGNVYTASGTTTKKYDSSGNLVWSVDHGAGVNSVAVDSSGNVYIGGTRTSSLPNVTTRKYDSSGSLVWSVDHGTTVGCIAVDKSGNVYTGGSRTTQIIADQIDGGLRRTTRKYDSSGNLIWSRDHVTTVSTNNAQVSGIAVDADGNVYTGGIQTAATANVSTRKYDSSGNLLWSVAHGNSVSVYTVAVDLSGNVYTGGQRSSNVTTRKYNSSGTLLWSVDHGNSVFGIAVDSSGNIYTAGQSTGTPTVTTRKYDSSGTLLYSFNISATVNRGIALSTNVSTLTQWS